MSGRKTDSLFEEERTQEESCTHIIRVAFESAVDAEFDYLVPDRLWPVAQGQRVEVPFGRADKRQIAFCVKSDLSREQSFLAGAGGRELKAVVRLVDEEPLLDANLMELARWIATYYVCPLGQVLAAMVPAAVKRGAGVRKEKYVYLADQAGTAPRGARQKQIVEYLRQLQAQDAENAVELASLLGGLGCTSAPVRSLAEKGLIRIIVKTVYRSLPVVPETVRLTPGRVVLNDDQRKALQYIQAGIDSERFAVVLLHGVTDSGKTELYTRAVEATLKRGKSAIVLLPEIALTAQTVQRFGERFEQIAVMHSGLTAAQRNLQWQKIRRGEARVVIGARSAVFAPLPNCGLIVVDEEHEPSYKQDTAPRYHGRDVAIKRAQLAGALCLLGSATPSLESLHNCRTKRHFSLVRLRRRVMDLPMPDMKLVDMRAQQRSDGTINLISEPLAQRLREMLAKKEQAILLLNRRGYSNFVFCPSCKYTLRCRNCDVTLTFHKSKLSTGGLRTITGKHLSYGYAACHHCGAQTLVPEKCPLCGKGMAMIGLGSQRLEEQLRRMFPAARIARIDSDSMSGQDYYRVLGNFGRGEIDMLAGTQILAKGLHFPNVTVVGIISADTCLYLPDFRANERTFQLICQVAGRAGRSRKKGTVFVQTFLPEQPAIRFALDGDFEGFVREELKHRRSCNLPPFWRLALIAMKDPKFDKLEAACAAMRERIDRIAADENLQLNVRGPMPAPISRLQRQHRMQIILRAPRVQTLARLFESLRRGPALRPAVRTAIDIDPVNLL